MHEVERYDGSSPGTIEYPRTPEHYARGRGRGDGWSQATVAWLDARLAARRRPIGEAELDAAQELYQRGKPWDEALQLARAGSVEHYEEIALSIEAVPIPSSPRARRFEQDYAAEVGALDMAQVIAENTGKPWPECVRMAKELTAILGGAGLDGQFTHDLLHPETAREESHLIGLINREIGRSSWETVLKLARDLAALRAAYTR